MNKTEELASKIWEVVKEIARTDQAAPDSYYADRFLKLCDESGLKFVTYTEMDKLFDCDVFDTKIEDINV